MYRNLIYILSLVFILSACSHSKGIRLPESPQVGIDAAQTTKQITPKKQKVKKVVKKIVKHKRNNKHNKHQNPTAPDLKKIETATLNTNRYFPTTIGSFWVYMDQDGNTVTRRSIADQAIKESKVYHFQDFVYEPDTIDWEDYTPFFRFSHYQAKNAGIILNVRDEVEYALDMRMITELDIFEKIIADRHEDFIDATLFHFYAQTQDILFLLPNTTTFDGIWKVNQIKASLQFPFEVAEEGILHVNDLLIIDYTIIETGTIKGTEDVETAAGTFKDCLRVEYCTHTIVDVTPKVEPDEIKPPSETITTVWFAPGVGIVKIHQKPTWLFLGLIPDHYDLNIPLCQERTFELQDYEIKQPEIILELEPLE